jgi:hypothetical protein
MTLLDRLRAQSRDKHPDPAIRLAFVEEIPVEERAAIAAIAREDDDPRVRRAAVAKLLDPAALGGVLGGERDETVRSQAAAMLRDIALDAFEGTTEADGVAAVDALSEPKTLAEIARAATRETVALRALARLSESHVLGSLARHAASEAARLGALSILRERGERGELLAVALNGEYKDAAAAAVEAFADREDLEQIAARSKNKSAAKRARALVREEDARLEVEEKRAAEARAEELRAAAEREAAARTTPVLAAKPEASQAEPVERVDEATERDRIRESETAKQAERAAREQAQRAEAERLEEEKREREAARLREHERVRREVLGPLQQLLARIEPLAAKADLSLKAGERALRDVRAAIGAASADLARISAEGALEIQRRLKAAQAALAPKVQELRDADDWRRWANLGVQEQLAQRMEALLSLADPEAVVREVRELQAEWRKVADAPRAQADAMWRRFKKAHDEVWARCEAHFAADAQVRADNLAKKLALCEQAESLADSSSWIQTAESLKRLQADWKAIGPVSRGHEKETWDRFRTACDRFFTRRQEDLSRLKTVWADNLAKKDALCAQAEALAESSDWDQAAAGIKRLQAEWKAIGPVKRSRAEAIWQRFRAACDKFFARHAARHDVARAERIAAREAICAELETAAALPNGDGAAPPPDLLANLRGLRSRWQQEVAARGVDPDRARLLDERFRAAFAAVVAHWPSVFGGTELDPDANRKRLESIVKRVEDLAASLAGPSAAAADETLSPTTRLAAMLKDALAANTIGGKADNQSRLTAAAEDVRQAQAAWSRVGPLPDEIRKPLSERFERACAQVLRRIGSSGSTGSGKPGGAGRPGRAGGPGGPAGSGRSGGSG